MGPPLASPSLGHLEARLLLSSLSSDRRKAQSTGRAQDPSVCFRHSLVHLIELVESGQYSNVLESSEVSRVLAVKERASAGSPADGWYAACTTSVQTYLEGANLKSPGEEDRKARGLLILVIGVAALYAFLQANITGPQVSTTARLPGWEQTGDWEQSARRVLAVGGSDFIGKFQTPQYILLARAFLLEPELSHTEPVDPSTSLSRCPESVVPSNPPTSASWWAARTALVHQRLLCEGVASLRAILVPLFARTLKCWGGSQLEEFELEAPEARTIAAALELEAGLMEHAYNRADDARLHFEKAGASINLSMTVVGALGFRTPHQVVPKVQMVMQTSSSVSPPPVDTSEGESDPEEVSTSADQPQGVTWKGALTETEVYMRPILVEEQGAAESARLSSVKQALILAECLDVKKQNPSNELREWQMAPYIEAVDAQPRKRPAIAAVAALLRARWERSRSRTKERALASMEVLVDTLRGADVKAPEKTAARRMRYAFSVWFPIWASLQKELGEQLVSAGLVAGALSIFEQLELWDNLITCYRLLGKVPQATSLVQERLKTTPSDPRLWCSLGDLLQDDSAYQKAWEVSGQRHARAQRSLARSAQRRGDHPAAMDHWAKALAINPLHPEGWFSLGFAAIKAGEDERALQALTRAVQLEPDNGEAWNNIAALNVKRGRSKEAFSALQEALKYRRESWQTWDNFVRVALDVRNLGQACHAMGQVLDLTDGKMVDLSSLSRLVSAIEDHRHPQAPPSSPPPPSAEPSSPADISMPSALDVAAALADEADSPEGEEAEPLEVPHQAGLIGEHLEQAVGGLLKRVVAGGEGRAGVWGVMGRYYCALGNLSMELESRLKHTRALQGSKWQQDSETFRTFAAASLALCQCYIRTAEAAMAAVAQGKEGPSGPGAGGRRELSAARMYLKNALKQAEERFHEDPMYEELDQCLQQVFALEERAKAGNLLASLSVDR